MTTVEWARDEEQRLGRVGGSDEKGFIQDFEYPLSTGEHSECKGVHMIISLWVFSFFKLTEKAVGRRHWYKVEYKQGDQLGGSYPSRTVSRRTGGFKKTRKAEH